METPTELHCQEVRKIFHYLKVQLIIDCFIKGKIQELVGFCNSDYAGDLNDKRSTPGYIFFLSGAAMSWSSRKRPVVTLSTTGL